MYKQQLGQFYTTNYKLILQNFKIPNDIKNIIEPFCGNGDLLSFIENKENYNIELYDIDPKIKDCINQNTLINPPLYYNKFIITNPPYIARNKNINKEIYDLYKCNDLYKAFLIEITRNICLGGILILPLNFLSSIRKSDIKIRKLFFDKYSIISLNIFEERVFEDTTYTICSFLFKQKETNTLTTINFYPSNKNIYVNFHIQINNMIGGTIYNLKTGNIYKVYRATIKTISPNTNIYVKCIDDKCKIKLDLIEDKNKYIDKTPNLSSRTYAILIIEPELSFQQQEKLIKLFNDLLDKWRTKYNSLFLCNFREGNRKRISFELVYSIIKYILEQNKNIFEIDLNHQ